MIEKMLNEGREEIRAMTKTIVEIKLKKASLSQVQSQIDNAVRVIDRIQSSLKSIRLPQ